MEDLINVLLLEPSTISDFDVEIVPIHGKDWSEVARKLEDVLDDHFCKHCWSGELTLKLKFEKYTKEQLANVEGLNE